MDTTELDEQLEARADNASREPRRMHNIWSGGKDFFYPADDFKVEVTLGGILKLKTKKGDMVAQFTPPAAHQIILFAPVEAPPEGDTCGTGVN